MGRGDIAGCPSHDCGCQYLSMLTNGALAEAGVEPSWGSVAILTTMHMAET